MSNTATNKCALISVYDKTGIPDFARELDKMGWKIIASGGTARAIAAAGVAVTDTAELVGGGAILGHRVVTLSREIHAGLLADLLKPEDVAELVRLDIPVLRMVVCGFYPLENAIAAADATVESVIEQTDIGGPCMARSAAKGRRIIITRTEDRTPVLKMLKAGGDVSDKMLQTLRARAELVVAQYCLASATFQSGGKFAGITGEHVRDLRYGENPQQADASMFSCKTNDPLALDKFRVIEGNPGFVNWTDVDRGLQTMTHTGAGMELNFGEVPLIAIGIKHGNPCGAAVGSNPIKVVRKMAMGDSLALFGGVVMVNFRITQRIAEAMVTAGKDDGKKQSFDAVVAPSFTDGAIKILSRGGARCKLLVNPALETESANLDTAPLMRMTRGGWLIQPNHTHVLDLNDDNMVIHGERRDKKAEIDLILAWAINVTSNSNTITVVNDSMLLGNGVGQQARVWAAKLCVSRGIDAKHATQMKGAVATSDSFCPYPDAPEALINAGVTTIYSLSGSTAPGGGDSATIQRCEESDVTLYMFPNTMGRGFFMH